MTFNTNTTAKSPFQFTARLVSKKTGKTATFINIVDEYSRAIFGVEAKKVSAKEAIEILPKHFGNDHFEVVITDLTETPTIITPEEY